MVSEGGNRILRNWLPLIGYLGLIFYFSHQPEPTGDVTLPLNDKLIHVLEFFPLPLLFIRVLRTSSSPYCVRHCVILGIVASLLYALTDEVHQMFIPNREASVLDLMADSIGIFLGAYFLRGVRW